MKAGLAFWAGVIGAAVMVLGMWIVRMAGGTDFNFGSWWGSMLTGTTTVGSWWLGFVIHLILGGLIGLVYAASFEAIGRSNWFLGLIGGVIQLIIGGFALGWISNVHPAIPQVIAHPGFFASYWGAASTVTFCIVTLLFGIIVGGMYMPTHVKRPELRTRPTMEEEQPVGVGREYHGREHVSVPPAPEERAPEDRPVSIGKGRRS